MVICFVAVLQMIPQTNGLRSVEGPVGNRLLLAGGAQRATGTVSQVLG